MITAFNEWLQIPDDKLEVIKRIIELLHTASLLYVSWGRLDGANIQIHPRTHSR